MPDPVAVNSMFARIARRYDVANRMLSGGVDIWWRRQLVRSVEQRRPSTILDLATGSGDVAFALGRALNPEVRILGMDFCQPMLDEAEIKKREKGGFENVSFEQGDALALPLEDAQFDVVTISFGLRNMADRVQALREMRRVLKPGGSVFVLEFSQPYAWFRPLYYFYLRHLLPRLAGAVTGERSAYQYLNATIEKFPNRAELSREFEQAGFASIQARPMSLGIVALHVAQR